MLERPKYKGDDHRVLRAHFRQEVTGRRMVKVYADREEVVYFVAGRGDASEIFYAGKAISGDPRAAGMREETTFADGGRGVKSWDWTTGIYRSFATLVGGREMLVETHDDLPRRELKRDLDLEL